MSPFPNGSNLIVHGHAISEEFTLYCSCSRPMAISRWNWADLARYAVSNSAYERGYGSTGDIVLV